MSNQKNHSPDTLLDALLHKLPERPVASNFTFRVLQAVEQERIAARKRASWFELLHHPLQLIPRLAVAALALCLGLFSYQRYEATTQVRMAESVAIVAQVSSLPSPDLLQDFEAVRHLSATPAADEELLTLLQ